MEKGFFEFGVEVLRRIMTKFSRILVQYNTDDVIMDYQLYYKNILAQPVEHTTYSFQ